MIKLNQILKNLREQKTTYFSDQILWQKFIETEQYENTYILVNNDMENCQKSLEYLGEKIIFL